MPAGGSCRAGGRLAKDRHGGLAGCKGRVVRPRARGELAGAHDANPVVREDNERMRSRWLVVGAAVWTAGYGGIYLAVVSAQGNPPVWWYVALLAVAAVSLVFGSAAQAPRPIVIVAACPEGGFHAKEWLRPGTSPLIRPATLPKRLIP